MADLPFLLLEKEETVSTNDDCRAYFSAHPETGPVIITAKRQTGGRGRQGKSFASPAGGLYMSLLVPASVPFQNALSVTGAAAVAVSRAIERLVTERPVTERLVTERTLSDIPPRAGVGLSTGLFPPFRCGIKWVNDVYVRGKKLCGILTEAVNDYERGLTLAVILGIGVNVREIPHGVEGAASIYGETGMIPPLSVLRDEIAKETLLLLRKVFAGEREYMEEYRARSVVVGQRVRCLSDGVWFEAEAESIDQEGALCLRLDGGERVRLTSGEVTLRIAEEKDSPPIIR